MPITQATQNVIAPNICTTDTNQTVTGTKTFSNIVNGTPLCYRNKIINGDFSINQKQITDANYTVSTSTPFVFGPDRWQGRNENATTGTFTLRKSISTESSIPGQNFLRVNATNANASITALGGFCVAQYIEASDITDLKWGTANALPVTISFFLNSNFLNKNLALVIQNDSFDMMYAVNFVTPATDTEWVKKTITIPGPTTGTWVNTTGIGATNGIGIRLIFGLGAGSSRRVSATGSWISGGTMQMTGTPTSDNLLSAISQNIQIAGVQLEAGPVATPFEYLPISTKLGLCQRYVTSYAQEAVPGVATNIASGVWTSTTAGNVYLPVPVEMRANPTLIFPNGTLASYSVSNGTNTTDLSGGNLFVNTLQTNDTTIAISFTSFNAIGTAGSPARLFLTSETSNGRITLSSEL